MRSIQALGVICMAGFCTVTAAQQTTGTHSNWRSLAPAPADAGKWPGGVRADRLGYLGSSRCHEASGCSSARRLTDPRPDYDYVDALDLGTYGPMDFKFTGKRVKLKVRF